MSRKLPPVAARCGLSLPLVALLGGCDMVVLNPSGDVARQQGDLVLWSTGLMLLIIIPVMVLTVLFAWRYRAGNKDAEYKPDWDHSIMLELIIWSAPLLIIIALGALTWTSTHLLDPYRGLGRLSPTQAVAANERPLEVQVVSLDWKWLFIYPEQGVATVNELVVPVGRQVQFRLTSSSVMNAFYVPAMAGMIYTMPGMETKLHAVMNRPGQFDGMSSNYSGAGFSHMRFKTHAVDDAGFARWVSEAKVAKRPLDTATYLQLEKPSEKVPPMRFGAIDKGLFDRVVEMCPEPNHPCDAPHMGHGGQPGVNNRGEQPGEPKGALFKRNEEKGSSPNVTKPRGPAEGTQDPGSPANRNMTQLLRPRTPGASAADRA
ncbi:ubiquinol oxidase subunit II [Sphingomonas sp. ac-8]|uniref:ubiquinol oxidase subunit II n=1 Tax=Sphingomonas sp. ac-8 TaxID=3242977 RepID=UPI003A802DDB